MQFVLKSFSTEHKLAFVIEFSRNERNPKLI